MLAVGLAALVLGAVWFVNKHPDHHYRPHVAAIGMVLTLATVAAFVPAYFGWWSENIHGVAAWLRGLTGAPGLAFHRWA